MSAVKIVKSSMTLWEPKIETFEMHCSDNANAIAERKGHLILPGCERVDDLDWLFTHK